MPNKIKDLLELYKEEIDKLGREHYVLSKRPVLKRCFVPF